MNITEFQHTFYVTTQQLWCEEKNALCKIQSSGYLIFFSFFGKWQYIYWFGTDML